MEKDYYKSTKYSQDELDSLKIPYSYRNDCQNERADYLSCLRTHPAVFENFLAQQLPIRSLYSSCYYLHGKMLKCEEYRERELSEEMKKIHLMQIQQK